MDPIKATAEALSALILAYEAEGGEVAKAPDGRPIFRKHFTGEVRAVQEEIRTIEFVGSDETVDRYGDIVAVDGWDLEDYRRNPVILYGHDYMGKPIGKALEVGPKDGKLIFRVQFATAEESPEADQVYRLIKGGYLQATSVGFIPHEWVDVPAEPATGEAEGKGDPMKPKRKPRRRYTKQELLELSIVAIPANPNALQMAVSKGVLTAEEARSLERGGKGTEEVKPTPAAEVAKDATEGLLVTMQASMVHMSKSMDELTKAVRDLIGEPVDTKAIGKPGETPSGDPSAGLYDDLFPQVAKLAETVAKVSKAKK